MRRGANTSMSELFPLAVYPFPLSHSSGQTNIPGQKRLFSLSHRNIMGSTNFAYALTFTTLWANLADHIEIFS